MWCAVYRHIRESARLYFLPITASIVAIRDELSKTSSASEACKPQAEPNLSGESLGLSDFD